MNSSKLSTKATLPPLSAMVPNSDNDIYTIHNYSVRGAKGSGITIGDTCNPHPSPKKMLDEFSIVKAPEKIDLKQTFLCPSSKDSIEIVRSGNELKLTLNSGGTNKVITKNADSVEGKVNIPKRLLLMLAINSKEEKESTLSDIVQWISTKLSGFFHDHPSQDLSRLRNKLNKALNYNLNMFSRKVIKSTSFSKKESGVKMCMIEDYEIAFIHLKNWIHRLLIEEAKKVSRRRKRVAVKLDDRDTNPVKKVKVYTLFGKAIGEKTKNAGSQRAHLSCKTVTDKAKNEKLSGHVTLASLAGEPYTGFLSVEDISSKKLGELIKKFINAQKEKKASISDIAEGLSKETELIRYSSKKLRNKIACSLSHDNMFIKRDKIPGRSDFVWEVKKDDSLPSEDIEENIRSTFELPEILPGSGT